MSNKPKEAGASDDNQKYEILYRKEKEINEFMEKYEVDKSDKMRELTNTQETIVALLEHMQKNLQRQNKLPNSAQVEDMKADLAFK